MQIRIERRVVALRMFAAVFMGCTQTTAHAVVGEAAGAPAAPTTIAVFLDASASMNVPTQQRHRRQVDGLIASLRSGDALYIVPIMKSSAPHAIYEGATKAVAPNPGKVEVLASRRELAKLHQAAHTAIAAYWKSDPPRARGTNLLGSIRRLVELKQTYVGGRLVVHFFSDMLNTEGGLDLERTRFRPEHLDTLLLTLARRHGWLAESLKGVEIHCHLATFSDDEIAFPANDTATLELFYRALFSDALGAELKTFSSLM